MSNHVDQIILVRKSFPYEVKNVLKAQRLLYIEVNINESTIFIVRARVCVRVYFRHTHLFEKCIINMDLQDVKKFMIWCHFKKKKKM